MSAPTQVIVPVEPAAYICPPDTVSRCCLLFWSSLNQSFLGNIDKYVSLLYISLAPLLFFSANSALYDISINFNRGSCHKHQTGNALLTVSVFNDLGGMFIINLFISPAYTLSNFSHINLICQLSSNDALFSFCR